MEFYRIGKLSKNERGFTLIEILVALAISGIVVSAIASTIFQVADMKARETSHITAVNEMENAVHWITRDTMMAQNVTTTDPDGFPLILTWVEWNGTSYEVVYSTQGKELQRSCSVNGETPTTSIIVPDINSAQSDCYFAGGMLTFDITATVGDYRSESETRSFTVRPRPVP